MFCVFCLTNTGFVQCYSLGSHKVCCTLVLNFTLFSFFCFVCFASQTLGLCSAFPSAPVKSVTRFCYVLVRNLFCMFCLTNTGFVQCYSLGSHKVCCTLVLYFAIFSNFCFACFASQTSGLCSAIPSAPVKSVVRLCLIFLYSVIFVFACFASQTSGLCSAFPSAPVKSVTRFCGFSQNFVLRVLPHKHRVCAVLLPRLPSSLLHACVHFALFSNFLLYVFCLTNIGLVQCFSLRLPSSLHPFGFLCFIQFAFVMRALPNKLRFVQ